MVKQIIHLADIHIRTFKMHEEYTEVFNSVIKKIKEIVKDYSRDEVRIVIVGDYVHQKITISNELLMIGTWFLSELESIAPVILVAGNHDLLENNKSRLDSLTPMVQLLPKLDIKYFKESKCYLDDNLVWSVYSIFENNARPDIESGREIYGDDKTYIGLFHAPINGASTDTGFNFEESQSLSHFEGCDIVMLGDIHKRQSFKYKDTLIAYPSSLIQQNFGENVSKHGFLVWDVDSRTFEEYDIETNFGFYQFKVNSLDDIENNNEKLMNG